MLKISIDQHTLYLADDVKSFHLDAIGKKKVLTYRYTTPKKFKKILENISQYDVKNHIIYHDNIEELKLELANIYEIIEAAGGLVTNELRQILFIYRNSKWDLPKGKIEKNETRELAAIREVEEECGLKIDKLHRHLMTTYHSYSLDKKNILKSNYWYLMSADSRQALHPQREENIEQAVWKSIEEIPALMDNSYSSIRDVLAAYTDIQ